MLYEKDNIQRLKLGLVKGILRYHYCFNKVLKNLVILNKKRSAFSEEMQVTILMNPF